MSLLMFNLAGVQRAKPAVLLPSTLSLETCLPCTLVF
uniref:Uncharacterized protein n=1 Tax=Arundo donax TaxID=35708 RepID=A0A0A8YQX9_ARUDO